MIAFKTLVATIIIQITIVLILMIIIVIIIIIITTTIMVITIIIVITMMMIIIINNNNNNSDNIIMKIKSRFLSTDEASAILFSWDLMDDLLGCMIIITLIKYVNYSIYCSSP